MTTASDLYTFRRTGPGVNDFRIEPRRPIQTSDSATFGRERRERSSRTRDDVLEGNPPQKRISLGRLWTATSEELRDFVTDPVKPLLRGKNYVLGEVVGAED